ncbi:MAG: winged helix-turn-helix transcriptional regulator [Candidatus Aenigmarchaeota archaeon]|nr:winged helix-turn-helix transcriptional regulator [Candidatus Aenigmarchaeota archaeon]
MKLFQIVSILAVIVSLSVLVPSAYAAIQFYGVESDLGSDGKAAIKLTITFDHPVKSFQLTVLGKVNNLKPSSNAGPVGCVLVTGEASIINCQMNLTEEKRTLELLFETNDLVKAVDGKNLFNLDLSLSEDINQASALVKIPEGYALATTDLILSVSPPATNIISDGRRIIATWSMENITSAQSFKFQVLYEPVEKFPVALVSTGIIGFLAVSGLAFYFFRRMRRPEEVILSVLDDFEKQVLQVITNAGGETHQKKVVHETNLSKAKVSRVIKRLQDRGLVHVVRLGRTNKLKLAKEKFKGEKGSS